MRPGELLALHWDDVDLDAGLLRVSRAIVRRGGRVEEIADLLGQANTRVTSAVYRHPIAPTVEAAKEPMDRLFGP